MVWRCLCISWYLLLSCASTSHSFFSFLPCCYHVDLLPQIDQALNKFFFVHSRSHIAMIFDICWFTFISSCIYVTLIQNCFPWTCMVYVIIVVVYCNNYLAEHFKSWNWLENTMNLSSSLFLSTSLNCQNVDQDHYCYFQAMFRHLQFVILFNFQT